MKILRFFLRDEIELSPYGIPEGEDEYRVEREILSTIHKGSDETALEPKRKRGSLSSKKDPKITHRRKANSGNVVRPKGYFGRIES